jgi:N-acetylglucosaminyl-diphospho-decaprenol L-rhamnosyltransferase
VSAPAGAVVVNYFAEQYLSACVASLEANRAEVVAVVDNGSEPARAEAFRRRFPEARWTGAGANLGYGRAVNLGVALLGCDHVLVCNADVVLGQGALPALTAYLDAHPEVALVGPRICDPEGRLYPSARVFPDLVDAFGHGLLGHVWGGNPFSRRYKMSDWDHAQSRQVDWVSGACFLARRRAWEEVGGFDPSYFMYMEDVDLCWRLGRAGWAVAYEPSATVTHVQGVSADLHPYRMLAAHHRSMWRFARRTTPPARRPLLPAVATGLAGRLSALIVTKAVARALSRASRGRPQPGRAPGGGAAG